MFQICLQWDKNGGREINQSDNFIDRTMILKSISNIFLFIQLQLCLTYLPQITNFTHHGSSNSQTEGICSIFSIHRLICPLCALSLWTVAKWLVNSTTDVFCFFFFFWYWPFLSHSHSSSPATCNLCLPIPYSPLEITSFGKLLLYLGNYYILLKLPIYLLISSSDCLLFEVKELIIAVRHYIPII